MRHSWQSLMNYVADQSFRIERVKISDSDIAIEGDFNPPPLACLSVDDQLFAASFIASHGSIKKMEALFGISYPTVKNRLNRIASRLDVPRVEVDGSEDRKHRKEILEKLDQGDISFNEAMEELS
jgi:hypothetical protein